VPAAGWCRVISKIAETWLDIERTGTEHDLRIYLTSMHQEIEGTCCGTSRQGWEARSEGS